MSKIFISYRRDDSADVTGRIYDRLLAKFGADAIFKDVDSIPLGVDFKTYIEEVVNQCLVEVVIIGRHWVDAVNDKGEKRLNDPADFVRIEVQTALERNIPVIPVLVQGASVPKQVDLPESLAGLAFRNGTEVGRDPHFHNDVDRLIVGLESWLTRPRVAQHSETKAATPLRKDFSVIVDSRPLIGNSGQVWKIPITPETEVWDLLDKIYFSISKYVNAWTYGEMWVLRDRATGTNIPYLGTNWAKVGDLHQLFHDNRYLQEAGIMPGMYLEIVSP